MKISDLITLLNNMLVDLYNQRAAAVARGNVALVTELDGKCSETRNTLDQLRAVQEEPPVA